jgi:quercetin dioxygenase-like cupin family protein
MTRPVRVRSDERRARPPRFNGTVVEVIADAATPLKTQRCGVSTLTPGTIEAFHYHSVEAIEYIISGRAIVRDLSLQTIELGPGDAILFPPGPDSAHEWQILGPDPCVILWMYPGPEDDKLTWVDTPTEPIPPAESEG